MATVVAVCRSPAHYVRSGPPERAARNASLPFEYLMIFDFGGYTLGAPRCVLNALCLPLIGVLPYGQPRSQPNASLGID